MLTRLNVKFVRIKQRLKRKIVVNLQLAKSLQKLQQKKVLHWKKLSVQKRLTLNQWNQMKRFFKWNYWDMTSSSTRMWKTIQLTLFTVAKMEILDFLKLKTNKLTQSESSCRIYRSFLYIGNKQSQIKKITKKIKKQKKDIDKQFWS